MVDLWSWLDIQPSLLVRYRTIMDVLNIKADDTREWYNAFQYMDGYMFVCLLFLLMLFCFVLVIK